MLALQIAPNLEVSFSLFFLFLKRLEFKSLVLGVYSKALALFSSTLLKQSEMYQRPVPVPKYL